MSTTADTLSAQPQHHHLFAVIAAIGTSIALGAAGLGYAAFSNLDTSSTSSSSSQVQTMPQQNSGGGWSDPGQQGQQLLPTQPGDGQDTSTSTADTTDATAEQEEGLVYINSTLDYGTGESAGTGMILTSDGEILTNHHVVEGATSISVEIVSTGETYTAEVVGYDATNDVAVLQLENASGLTTIDTDTSGVSLGDEVVAVGNANGDGGAASASAGTVTALDQSITVGSESSNETETLSGLIETDADMISGDSGGALYDADGDVVGMNTAASSGTADIVGYAIPIADALAIADQIEAGVESGSASTTVTVGETAFLGVQLNTDGTVADVVDDSAAESAGITAGSTITSVAGTTTSTADELAAAIATHSAGDRVSITWTDATGSTHTATVTLGSGPVG